MNNNLQGKTNELLLEAIDFIERSGDFIAEQAPIVVQEFLTYRFIEACIWASTSVAFVVFLLAIVATWGLKVRNMEWLGDGEHDPPWRFIWALFTAVAVVASSSAIIKTTIPYTLDAIKIKTAPRVYLIEELPKLITGDE